MDINFMTIIIIPKHIVPSTINCPIYTLISTKKSVSVLIEIINPRVIEQLFNVELMHSN
jgi:hypothetical protein